MTSGNPWLYRALMDPGTDSGMDPGMDSGMDSGMESGPQLTDESCRACAAILPSVSFEVKSWRDGSSHQVCECKTCGTLNLVGRVDPAEFYRSDYHSFEDRTDLESWTGLVTLGRANARIARMPTVEPLLRPLDRVLPTWSWWFRGFQVASDGLILDVGSGSGALLRHLHRFGFSNLVGVDPFLPLRQERSTGPMRLARVSLQDFGECADAIIFNHSLEHVDDPLSQLVAARDRLRGSGPVVVELPLADSAVFRRYRDNWWALDMPLHRFIPTVLGIDLLCERAGLRRVRTRRHTPAFEYLASESISRCGKPAEARTILSEAEVAWFTRLASRERAGDRAHGSFVLEKSDRPPPSGTAT